MDSNPRLDVDRPSVKRGRFDAVWQDGYGYSTRYRRTGCKGEVRYLLCMHRLCSATASVRPNGDFSLGLKTHTHPRDEFAEQKACLKRKLRAAVLEAPYRSVRDIYDDVALLYPQTVLYCPYLSVEGSMRRWRTIVPDDGLAAAATVDNMCPVKDGTDDLTDANSSDTPPDDHFIDAAESTDSITVNGLEDGAGVACHADPLGVDEPLVVANVAATDTTLDDADVATDDILAAIESADAVTVNGLEDGAGVACHADPLGVYLATSVDEPLVVANPADTETTLGRNKLNMHPNPRVGVDPLRGKRRFDIVWQDGYGYTTRYTRVGCGGEVRYLICTDRFCRATASVRPNGDLILGRKTHTHPRDRFSERNDRFKRNLRVAVLKRHDTSLRDIYDEVAALYPQAVFYCPYVNVQGSMRRWRTLARDDGLPILDDADVATDDILAATKSTDAVTVNGLEDGAGIACHADPLGVYLATSVDEPFVVANAAATETTLDCNMLNMHPNRRVDLDIPHYKRRLNVIWQDGYGYKLRYTRPGLGGKVRYLICIHRLCRATASVRPNGDFNLGRRTHTHPKDECSQRYNRFKRNLRAAVLKRHDRSVKDIYDEVAALYPQAALSCPYITVENSMRRWQAKARDDGLPIIDDADVAHTDYLAGANSSETAPVDDFTDAATESTDVVIVNGLEDGAGVACHADTLGVDEPLVVANAAATETTLGRNMLHMDPNTKVDVHPLRGKRRFNIVWQDGYGYTTRYTRVGCGGVVRYLICVHRFCRATASVRPNGDFNLGRRTHTHPRDGFAERNNRFKRNLKAAVLKQHNRSLRDIYNEVTSLYPQAVFYCPYTSVCGSMRRWCNQARDDGLPIIDDADIAHIDDIANANSSDTAHVDDPPDANSSDTAPDDELADSNSSDTAPVYDDPDANSSDTAPVDDLPDASSSDTAPVDDLSAVESIDVATVNGLQVENGDDVKPHAVLLATSADEPLIVANATDVVVTSSNRHCLRCQLNIKTHIFIPCGHFGVCDDCAQKLNDSKHQQCPVCRQVTQSIIRVVECRVIFVEQRREATRL